MLELKEHSPTHDLTDLRLTSLKSLTAPMDGMWESFVTMGRQMEVRWAAKRAGYCSLNDEGQLLQFHLSEAFEPDAQDIFSSMIALCEVKGAIVSTADPLFLGLCLDRNTANQVHTYLYTDHNRGSCQLAGFAETTFTRVETSELEEIAEGQRQSLDEDPGDWLVGYLGNLIQRGELFALSQAADGELLGTGEARVSDSQPPFVDLGVITVREHRNQGVAAHILTRLKDLCYERGQTPICSTTVGNISAQRTIAKAGFASKHRLIEIAF